MAMELIPSQVTRSVFYSYKPKLSIGLTSITLHAVFCLSPVSFTDPHVIIPNAWPDGTYSLPQVQSPLNCPNSGDQFTWETGYRLQDTEDNDSNNHWSPSLHLSGYFGKSLLGINYCTKVDKRNDYGIQWPKGSYCILKKGDCPAGFNTGTVEWDDEDDGNANYFSGVLPDGSYGKRNTIIHFCCRSDQNPRIPIILPTDQPFYLYRQSRDGCQTVKGMNVDTEFVFWDTEDDDNSSKLTGNTPYEDANRGKDIRLYFCYYYPSTTN